MYQQNANQVVAIIGTFLPLILTCSGCGIVSHLIARKKRYSGYFWTGFFLLVFGVMYVASLPFFSETSSLSDDEKQLLAKYRSLDQAGKEKMRS